MVIKNSTMPNNISGTSRVHVLMAKNAKECPVMTNNYEDHSFFSSVSSSVVDQSHFPKPKYPCYALCSLVVCCFLDQMCSDFTTSRFLDFLFTFLEFPMFCVCSCCIFWNVLVCLGTSWDFFANDGVLGTP